MLRSIALTLLFAIALAGCAAQSQRTAKAVGCNVMSVDILPSEASRRGVTTDWCARCDGQIYRCVGNAARDKVQCRPARENDRCGGA